MTCWTVSHCLRILCAKHGVRQWQKLQTRPEPSCLNVVGVSIPPLKSCWQVDVELLANGTAKAASQSNGQTAYHVVNGHCDCKDYPKAPHQFCKHRLGAAIARRAQELTTSRLTQLDHTSNGNDQAPKSGHMRFVHSCCHPGLFLGGYALDRCRNLRGIIEMRELVLPWSMLLHGPLDGLY